MGNSAQSELTAQRKSKGFSWLISSSYAILYKAQAPCRRLLSPDNISFASIESASLRAAGLMALSDSLNDSSQVVLWI